MKKSLLALAALSAIAGAAQAQSSVTVYGLLDASVYNITNQASVANTATAGTTLNTGATSAQSTANNGSQTSQTATKFGTGLLQTSRFGLKGSEDLGNGAKANFQLESGISDATGVNSSTAGVLFDRAAWVGLSNKYVNAQFGRMTTFAYDQAGSFITDPMGLYLNVVNQNSTRTTSGALANNNTSGATVPAAILTINPMNAVVSNLFGTARTNNTVRLDGTYAGVTWGAGYSIGGAAGNNSSGAASELQLGYQYSGFKIAANYMKINDNLALANPNSLTAGTESASSNIYPYTNSTAKTYGVGAVWNANSNSANSNTWGLQAGWNKVVMNNTFQGAANSGTTFANAPVLNAFFGVTGSTSMTVADAGAYYMVTPAIKLTAAYYNTKLNPGLSNTAYVIGQGSSNTEALLANYFLSKRSDVYAVVANQSTAGGLAQYTANNNGATATLIYGLGMRHTF